MKRRHSLFELACSIVRFWLNIYLYPKLNEWMVHWIHLVHLSFHLFIWISLQLSLLKIDGLIFCWTLPFPQYGVQKPWLPMDRFGMWLYIAGEYIISSFGWCLTLNSWMSGLYLAVQCMQLLVWFGFFFGQWYLKKFVYL